MNYQLKCIVCFTATYPCESRQQSRPQLRGLPLWLACRLLWLSRIVSGTPLQSFATQPALQAERGGQKPGLALHSLTNLLPLLVPSYLPLRFLTGCLNNLGSSQLHSSRNSTADPQEFMQRPFHLHLAVLGPGFPPACGHQTSPQILGLLGLQPALLSSQKNSQALLQEAILMPWEKKTELLSTRHCCSPLLWCLLYFT